MQPCRIIYCSSTALHVSSDIFAHHLEHLNCTYSFWYYSCVSLPAVVMDEQAPTYVFCDLRVSCSPMTTAGSDTLE
jgi:hypothetical protein